MGNNYIIDLKSCYLPTVNDWTGLLDCINSVKTNTIDLDKLGLLFPSFYCVIYRGNQLVITFNCFCAHVYKEEVSGYVICKITDAKQIPHLEIEKEMCNMLTEVIDRNKQDLSPEPKITRQSHPYLPPNG